MQSLQAVSSAASNQWLIPKKLSGDLLKQQHIYQDIIHLPLFPSSLVPSLLKCIHYKNKLYELIMNA